MSKMNESSETIKKVAEEGLEARNLVNWIDNGSFDGFKTTGKPPTSPRPYSFAKPSLANSSKDVDSHLLLKTKRRGALSRPKSRLRSASAGRNPEKDLRARYWTFLFENLHRAVDEIYQTCEMDESIVESKEAIMMLENYSKDFHALIQYININKNYEKTAPINRPTSLAWEVRKSSPGKSLLKNVFIEKITAGNNQAKRILCFDSTNDSQIECDAENNTLKLESQTLPLNSKEVNLSEKNENSEEISDCQSRCLNVQDCAISISVVQETNEIFPCNEGLVINEILCMSDKISAEKPSIPETDSEIINPDSEDINLISNCEINTSAALLTANKEKSEITSSAEESNEKLCALDKETEIKDKSEFTVAENFAKTQGVEDKCNEALKNKSEIAIITKQSNENKNKLINDIVTLDEDIINKVTKQSNENKNELINDIVTLDEDIINTVTESSSKVVSTCLNSQECNADFEESSNGLTSSQSPLSNEVETATPLRRKVLVKKSSKGNNEKINSTHSTCRQMGPNEENSSSKTCVKLINIPTKILNKDKMTSNTSARKNESSASNVETSDNTTFAKNTNTAILAKKTANKTLSEKSTNIPPAKSVGPKPISGVRKVSPKVDVVPEEKKTPRSYSKTSAIKRNISYISSLSSKNQQEKAANEEKKKPTRTISHAMRLPQKSGSMSSLHKISASRRWSDKASSFEQIPEISKSNADEDSDGWETVRGRNRCRNSPAKKIPFSSDKNGKALDIAKLNQSKFGGFPYTTKNISKTTENKTAPKKDIKTPNKEKHSKNENSRKTGSSDMSNSQNNCTSKKLSTTKNFNNASQEKCITIESKSKLNGIEIAASKTDRLELLSKNDRMEWLIELELPEEVSRKISRNMFKPKHLVRSASVPCINEVCKNTLLSKTKSLSEQSLTIKKYSKFKHHSRSSIEKIFNSTKKKSKKSTKLQDPSSVENSLNASLDESDTGLTSDDQDGQTSHDEAYDAQCQELYDTAWKYKILEQQVHKLELSWGEQMDRFDMELRTPGRALEMHEKLSSPFRKKSLMESIRLQEEKQVKAREQRERLLEEKLQKIKEIEKKRQEMRTLVEQRQEKQRVLMEQKLQRAEEKRKKQLQMIIRKAHDEEEKVNEIAFINTLEAQNKRYDLISKEKDHEARLHDIQEERQRKQEEKAAKEAAAEERRKLLEAERQARLNEMQEKRKMRDHKVEQLFLVKEKERQELANQKARDREQRLSALNAQQQITIEELQKKIQLKQEESARRHEENMEQIRQKAFELSVRRCSSNNDDAPQPVPYETKKICTMCNVLIGSEVYLLSHLRGKKHQETVKDRYQGKDPSVEELELYNLKHIVDASTDQLDPNIAFDKERQKALKKRCKKLRQRMSNRGQEYETQLEKSTDTVNSIVKSKMTKVIADIKKIIATYEKFSNTNNLFSSLDRCLKEINNILEKKLCHDKVAFRMVGGFGAVIDIFKLVSSLPMEKSAFLHKKIIENLNITSESLVEKCHENCLYLLFSNKIGCLLDLLIQRLNVFIPNNYNQVIVNTSKSSGLSIQVDATAGKLMHFLSKILSALSSRNGLLPQNREENICQKENYSTEFQFRVQDVISYTVSIGIIDKLSQYFNSIQGPIDNEEEVATYLLDCIAFLTSIIKLYSDCFTSNINSKSDDSTQLMATIKVTNMIGTVSLLYGLLLHSGVSSRGETPPLQLPKQIELLTYSTLCMLNHVAVMNLQAFQTVLGSEGLSLQLRHITSHLLWYCNHWTSEILLHEVILLVNYFTVLNVDNQSLIQAGQRPTVLQQLCSLPFIYFSDSDLTDILFPTLIACCYKNPSNKTILEQEMSSELLSNYIEVKYLNSEEYSSKSKKDVPEKRWLFSTRFPKNCWCSAKQYFTVDK